MAEPGGIGDDAETGLRPGTRLGKYEIVRLLGAGGMGSVYEAAHTEIGKRVAIKVLSLAIAAVPGARARFLREAQLTSRVRHPNIVDVTDMGSDAGQTYLVMEFLRGEDLAQRLGRTGPLPPQELADVMLPVCSAVVEAHKAGVTHRDLKPQNIFLAAGPHNTQPKVLDFGISKGNDLSGTGGMGLTGTGAMIGTPFYLAPEQIMDTRAAGPASDQYALGVIMYECLTGSRPFEAENLFVVFQAIVSGNPVPPSGRRAGIPPALEAVVLRAMNVVPGARFPSTIALGRALLPFASARMRSIWEEAFAGDDEFIVAAPSPGLTPAPLKISPAEPVPAPPTTPGWASTPPARMATPGPRVRGTVGIETTAPTGVEERRGVEPSAARVPGTWVMDSYVPDARSTPRPAGAKTRKSIAIIAVVVAGGLIAGVVLQRSRSDSGAHGDVTGAGAVGQGAPAPRPSSLNSGPKAPLPSAATEGASAAPPATAPSSAIAYRPAAEEPAPEASSAPERKTFQVSLRTEPATASIVLDGQEVGQGHFEKALPLDHVRHQLRLTADGYDDRELPFTDEPPPAILRLIRIPRSEPTPRPGARSARSPSPSPLSPSSSPPPRVPTARPARHAPTQLRPETTPIAPIPRSLNPNGAPVID